VICSFSFGRQSSGQIVFGVQNTFLRSPNGVASAYRVVSCVSRPVLPPSLIWIPETLILSKLWLPRTGQHRSAEHRRRVCEQPTLTHRQIRDLQLIRPILFQHCWTHISHQHWTQCLDFPQRRRPAHSHCPGCGCVGRNQALAELDMESTGCVLDSSDRETTVWNLMASMPNMSGLLEFPLVVCIQNAFGCS